MKIPRVRFTVWRMMLVVGVLAVVFGVIRLSMIRQRYLEKAANHGGFRARILRSNLEIAFWEARWRDQREGQPARYPWPAEPPFVPSIAKYHDDMRIKYERAARLPWLPVAPDPDRRVKLRLFSRLSARGKIHRQGREERQGRRLISPV